MKASARRSFLWDIRANAASYLEDGDDEEMEMAERVAVALSERYFHVLAFECFLDKLIVEMMEVGEKAGGVLPWPANRLRFSN